MVGLKLVFYRQEGHPPQIKFVATDPALPPEQRPSLLRATTPLALLIVK